MYDLIKNKKITDKQLLYLYNMVIRIEYCIQPMYLSKKDCDNIIIPFRKLFKQKLHMAILMANAFWKISLFIIVLEICMKFKNNQKLPISLYKSSWKNNKIH